MPKIANMTVLLCAGIALASANVWYSATRSTIPLKIDARVVSRETKSEKHPPIDNVYLLNLDPGGITQVDPSVYDCVKMGSTIQKNRWTSQLRVDSEFVELHWSDDFRGMVAAMPLTLMVLLLTALSAWRCGRVTEPAPQGESENTN